MDSRPGPQAQVDAIVAKFRVRLWSLRYLKRSGMEETYICKASLTYLRPVLEYIGVVIHSILTKTQSDELERQQNRALKIIYGFDKTSSQVLMESGLESLAVRRQRLRTALPRS